MDMNVIHGELRPLQYSQRNLTILRFPLKENKLVIEAKL